MNLSALPELLLAWVKNQGAALLQGNQAEGQPQTFQPGGQYEGKVLGQLAGGRHLVQVAGQKLDMGLPKNTQVGDTVKLTYLSAGPRPTFLLHQTPATAQVQITHTAQQVSALIRLAQTSAATPAALAQATAPAASKAGNPPGGAVPPGGGEPPKAAPGTTAVSGGAATPIPAGPARPIVANVALIQNYGTATAQPAHASVLSPDVVLLGKAVDELKAALPSTPQLKPNVMADLAPPSKHLLPERLAQAVSESGLFYEAHLARWIKGRHPLDALRREPQAQLLRLGAATAEVAELDGMPEEAVHLAGRQLMMLEGAPFQWQGLAWPGQWMDWLVQERVGGEGADKAAGQDGEGQWVTELRLTMPRMGQVHARLGLTGDQLGLRLTVPDAAIRDELRHALPLLIDGLRNSGLQAVGPSVEVADGGG